MFLHILMPSFAFQLHYDKIGIFLTVRVGVAQKTDFSDTKVATIFFGVCGQLIELFWSVVTFISITLFFDIIGLA